jgi:gamma-glutamyltranspeptidase/glutathione hydrolase
MGLIENPKSKIQNLTLLMALMIISCGTQRTGSVLERDTVSARSYSGMVSSATPEATEAGLAVLRRGGNAVDASVAVGFALAVTLPQAGNLGGGGFMVIRRADGFATTIDFREMAPGAATRDMYLDSAGNFLPDRSQIGALAAGVPGSPAGLLMALEKYGSMPRAEVMRPAIELAEQGFPFHPGLAKDINDKLSLFARFPGTLRVFAPDTIVPATGAIFRQADLAATLRRIADSGAPGFYSGATADLIVAEMRRSGGIITHDDLLRYRPIERKPVIGTYRGDTIISMPPPSSGGALLVHMLNMMELHDFSDIPYHSARHAHLLAEIMRRAYADRTEHLGDPDFHDVPVAGLINKEYARARAATIADSATPSGMISHGAPGTFTESPQTTHYSVVDKDGNCVSVTVTLNASFGSKLVVDGAGFLLNNEMDDFAAKPGAPNLYGLLGSEANSIAPGKRMLSSMTPTIILREGKPWLVAGTPGGSTIITTVLQAIHGQVDYGMSLSEAVESPRIHHQWRPDTIFHERGAFTSGTVDSLLQLGHHPVERGEASGRVDAIRIEREKDGRTIYMGWSDRRGYGVAKGM